MTLKVVSNIRNNIKAVIDGVDNLVIWKIKSSDTFLIIASFALIPFFKNTHTFKVSIWRDKNLEKRIYYEWSHKEAS